MNYNIFNCFQIKYIYIYMTNIIPMSSSVNELDSNNEINLDEILDNQKIYDHKFSKYLIDNKLLDNLSRDPGLDEIYYYHLKEFGEQIFINNFTGNILHILNIIIVFFLIIGFMFPNKFIMYHVILSMMTLIMWDIMDDKNFLVNKFSKIKNNVTLFPLSLKVSRILLLNLMIISILGLSFPKYSVFNLMNNLFINLKKYN